MNSALAEKALQAALAIEGSEEMAVVQNIVRTFAAPLGYDRFVLFSATATLEDMVDRIYWVEGDWFGDGEAVDAVTYVRRCPVTRHILETRQPFFWTKTIGAAGELYRVVCKPTGQGVHGVQVPIFGPPGLEGAMSLGGNRINASPSVRLVLPMVASAAFTAVRRLLEPEDRMTTSRLSAREREVLAWIAAGRRQNDVAATLRLSERTIENHLRRIRKRLGVMTTAQAVRMAIRNGDIKS